MHNLEPITVEVNNVITFEIKKKNTLEKQLINCNYWVKILNLLFCIFNSNWALEIRDVLALKIQNIIKHKVFNSLYYVNVPSPELQHDCALII